jgi:hypothetical protein
MGCFGEIGGEEPFCCGGEHGGGIGMGFVGVIFLELEN